MSRLEQLVCASFFPLPIKIEKFQNESVQVCRWKVENSSMQESPFWASSACAWVHIAGGCCCVCIEIIFRSLVYQEVK